MAGHVLPRRAHAARAHAQHGLREGAVICVRVDFEGALACNVHPLLHERAPPRRVLENERAVVDVLHVVGEVEVELRPEVGLKPVVRVLDDEIVIEPHEPGGAVGDGCRVVGGRQWAVGGGRWAVGGGQWAVGGGRWAVGRWAGGPVLLSTHQSVWRRYFCTR